MFCTRRQKNVQYSTRRECFSIPVAMLCTDLWGQVASVAGWEVIERLGADVAASEGLGGDYPSEGREGLLQGGAD